MSFVRRGRSFDVQARTRRLLAAGGGALALWIGWGLYQNRETERVPYETIETFDGAELRRYPQTVLVETTDDDRETAFFRLFRYISGENVGNEDVSMTAPVRQAGRGGEKVAMTAPVRMAGDGESISMTAPVRANTRNTRASSDDRGREDGGVTMAFYLPEEYTPATAPTPTDPRVRLVVEPPKVVAARQFSWYATGGRVARQSRKLLDALDRRGVEWRGRPAFLQYNDPYTPPFVRRNEVVVEVDRE
jgi:hypothetical protein